MRRNKAEIQKYRGLLKETVKNREQKKSAVWEGNNVLY